MFCGSGLAVYGMGNRRTAGFVAIKAVCHDPLNANGFYILDDSSIRYFDDAKDEVTLAIDTPAGDDSDLTDICSMLITSDGKTIWFADYQGSLFRLDTTRRKVSVVVENGGEILCWDRAPTRKPDSGFYAIASDDFGIISRFDTATNKFIRLPEIASLAARIYGSVCTPTGHLIIAEEDNHSKARVVAYDPICRWALRLDDVEVDSFCSLVLVDSTQTLVSTKSQKLVTFTLPSYYFLLPKCCDRDL